MKTIIYFIVLLLLASAIKANSFFSKIDTPRNPNIVAENALSIQILESVTVQDVRDVGISSYPGARIFQTTTAQAGMHFTVCPLSSDDFNAVIEYYMKELIDLKSKDLYGTFTFFERDEMEAMSGQIPVIQIRSAGMFTKIMPNARSVEQWIINLKIENEY